MALEFRKTVRADYPDVITDDAVRVMEALARFDTARKQIMAARIARRADRARKRERIGFLDPNGVIGRTSITVKDAREGNFVGAEIPARSASGSGSRAPARRRGPARRSRSDFATSPTRC